MKLIPMSDFALEQYSIKQSSYNFWKKIGNYAKFLKRPRELGMFVPVDEEGNVYVDYKAFNYAEGTTCVPYEGLFEIKANEKCKGWKYLNEHQEHKEDQRYYDSISYKKAALEYQKAKENVLFEGFKKCICNNEISVTNEKIPPICMSEIKEMTIESLVKNNLTLTESAIKQLGL